MAEPSEDRRAVRRHMQANDLSPWVAEFTRHLSNPGYAGLSVKAYDNAARHLAHWLRLAKVEVAEVDETIIDHFAQHRCRCPGKRRERRFSNKYIRRVRQFVEFLGERGVVRQKVTIPAAVFNKRVVAFQNWLREHRGISERTIDRHGRMGMRLLPALGNRLRGWNAPLVREVVIAETKRVSRAHVKTMATALRGYLRFLSAHGFCRAGLEHAVPTIPDWRLSTLPRYIDAREVEQLIATCDLTTPTGL
jgi:integrase/recombinase XerD